jgi:hypothetical protein
MSTAPSVRVAQRFHYPDGEHALERLGSRTTMTATQLLDLLHAGRAIWLTNAERNLKRRGHVLVYSESDSAWFVVVVAIDDPADGAAIVTVLEQAQFENDFRKPIDKSYLFRAMASVVKPDVANDWRKANMPPNRKDRRAARLRAGAVDSEAHLDPDVVIFKVDYRAPGTDVVMRKEFNVTRSYPAVAAFDDLKKCLDDDAFLQWFGSALLRACVPVDRVLTIKAARGQEPVMTLATEESLATAPVQAA